MLDVFKRLSALTVLDRVGGGKKVSAMSFDPCQDSRAETVRRLAVSKMTTILNAKSKPLNLE